MRLVARHPPRFWGDGKSGMRATPWPRAANRGRFSLCVLPSATGCLTTEYVKAGGAPFFRRVGKGASRALQHARLIVRRAHVLHVKDAAAITRGHGAR